MTLHLGENNLFGPLPYELSRLTRLQYLNLSSNKLSGRISTNLENPVPLSVLDLSLMVGLDCGGGRGSRVE